MAQPNIHTGKSHSSGFFEAQGENPLVRLRARMLRMKQHMLKSDGLDEEDEKEAEAMMALSSQEERENAYDEWVKKQHQIAEVEKDRQLVAAHLNAMQDQLTGIGNRRYYDDQMTKEIAKIDRSRTNQKRAPESHQPAYLSLLLLDIDYFKRINDTLGHGMGDKALKEMTDILKNVVRASDTIARVGGEEFVILLIDTKVEDALKKAEKIRSKVEEEFKKRLLTHCQSDKERELVMLLAGTVSIGVASYNSSDDPITKEKLFDKADSALYNSKNTGRNRVT